MQAIEQIVRSLDNRTKSIAESARNIAEQLNIKLGTARNSILAKRNGFKCLSEYYEHLARQRINPETNENFKSTTEYLNYLARRKGYEDRFERTAKNKGCDDWNKYRELIVKERGFFNDAEYDRYIRNRKENETPLQYLHRVEDEEFFQEGLETLTKEQLDFLPFQEREHLTEATRNRRLVLSAMKALNERERKIIYERYLSQEPKTLKQIGEIFGITRQAIEFTEEKAIAKMRRYLNRVSLDN